LTELQAALKENPSVSFNFEAAVCGGIPIIHTLQSDFLADRVTKVMGIMNGTTNFMLCKMEDEGAEYGAALAEAQSLGYAEADPTADVEGHDVQAKIALLTKLTFGKSVPFETVPTTGISKLKKVDFEYARTLKSTIKLLGTAVRNEDGSLAVFVSPTIVPLTSPLSSAKGPGNMVLMNSENLNTSNFAGPGAGRFPTANSVLNDLIRLSQVSTPRLSLLFSLSPSNSLSLPLYPPFLPVSLSLSLSLPHSLSPSLSLSPPLSPSLTHSLSLSLLLPVASSLPPLLSYRSILSHRLSTTYLPNRRGRRWLPFL
jgi:hypothetical protein